MFFFFQAEDGIRDLVRSRGLGDVYKRQDLIIVDYLQLMGGDTRNDNRVQEVSHISRSLKVLARELNVPVLTAAQSVSYTHLTLPTSDLV